MNQSDPIDWRPMSAAPKDGTRILVTVRATEQGGEEVDVVKWVRRTPTGEPGWVASDSDAAAPINYAAGELSRWAPLPGSLPDLRSARIARGDPAPDGEIDSSSI